MPQVTILAVTRLNFLGTGITPMLNIIPSILDNPYDRTLVNLVYCNHTENDIAFRDLLNTYAAQYPHRFLVTYVVSKPSTTCALESGHINQNICQKYLHSADNSPQVLICGPQLMALQTIKIMKRLGHSHCNIYAFGITDR